MVFRLQIAKQEAAARMVSGPVVAETPLD